MTLAELRTKYPDKEFGLVKIIANFQKGGWEIYVQCKYPLTGILQAESLLQDLTSAIEYCKANP